MMIALALWLCWVALVAPILGLLWVVSLFWRRASLKEVFAVVAYWAAVFALWTFIDPPTV